MQAEPIRLAARRYIEWFLTRPRPPPESERVLLTVLFTDIVGSTSIAVEIGDRRWRELLQRHDDAVRAELRRFKGSEVKNTGDGFLAAFQGPTKAIQGAIAIGQRTASLGLRLRIAVHTGECEWRDKDISGIAVHLAFRLLDHARAGEVVVSRTVRDLVVGSEIAFEERGEATLRGIPGTWPLFLVRTEEGGEKRL